ncbi:MAG TPA: manganese-binding transcriptional regulator MntR [Planctomycetaceae bacterium]|nr:manganese-binding transcriptional regulator MntR [Planctomycetaceae bacterium]
MLEHRTRIRGHERTRRDHATELTQDYVEAIAELQQQTGECRVRDLAKRFAVSHVTVNRAVARMKRDGYVDTEPYAPVTLTENGKALAEFSQRRHQIVFDFLRTLGVSERTASIDSEGIEHHVSDETLKLMEEFGRVKDLPE